jgi:hypothetical protein
MMDFYAPAANDLDSGNGHVVEAGPGEYGGTIRVETRRMDTIVSAAGVERLDLIKIDVEGFEWPVLRGGESTITKFRPHIVFEYNAESASRGGGTPELISNFLRTHRYRLFAIRQNWADEIEGDKWPRSGDIWAVPIP